MQLTFLIRWLLALTTTLAITESPSDPAEGGDIFLNYRLPNDTYPEHYNIAITADIHKGEKAFQGEVTIDIIVAKSTSSIVLHGRQIIISKVTIVSSCADEPEELSAEYEEEREFFTFKRTIDKEFDAEYKWKLTIIYSGELRDDTGFVLHKYIGGEGDEHYLAATYLESTDARYVFPCYDEPAKRANFTIIINHDPTYKAISNMPVNQNLSSPGKSVFLTTARIPTYLVAFVLCDLEYNEGSLNGIRQRVYSRSSVKHEQKWILLFSMKIMEYLSEYSGVEFMISKFDHIAIPDFVSAVDNWGLNLYSEDSLKYNKVSSNMKVQTESAVEVAHMISGQWFGNYVTIPWWSHLWVKAGLASLFTYRAIDNVYSEWNIWQRFYLIEYQKALRIDDKNSASPMTFDVQKPNEISSLYNEGYYYKAACVLFMWSNAVTDKVFQKAIQNFLRNNQYRTASEQQLFTAIQNAAEEENYKLPFTIAEMMGTWTRQAGFPLLTITRNYDDGTFNVKQETFYYNETIKDAKTWHVPINYAFASNPDFRDTKASHYLPNVWEMQVEAGIPKDDWLVVNKQSTGFYRIKYDAENYKLITKSLIKRPFTIHSGNRAQLMNDAFHLIQSNRLDYSILLEMLTYLKKEHQYAPWETANYIIGRFYYYLRNEDEFKLFVAQLITPFFQKLGVDEIPGEYHYDKIIRNDIIFMACMMNVKECLVETNNKLKISIKQKLPIESYLEGAIFCNGLRQSGDEEFNFIYQQVMDSTDKKSQKQLIFYLGCSRNKAHLRKLISSSIDESNNLHIESRYILLRRAYSLSNMGILACIEFLMDNWKAYGSLTDDSNPLDFDIRNMAKYVTSRNAEEKLLTLVGKINNSEYVTDSLERDVKETIEINFKWLKKHGQPIMSWISQYYACNKGRLVAVSDDK